MLIRRYTAQVYRLALRMLRQPEEAEDASQEAFLRMFRSLESYDATRPFGPWAAKITYHVCLRRMEGKGAAILREAVDRDLDVLKAKEGRSPERDTQRLQATEALERAMTHLSAQDRAILTMRYREELSTAEVAAPDAPDAPDVTEAPDAPDAQDTDATRPALEKRIEAYLEGRLDLEATVRFERDLLDPEVAAAFGRELMLRDLLATTPEAEPPPHLTAEIEAELVGVAALEMEKPGAETRAEKAATGWFAGLKNVFVGLGWSLRGSAVAVQAASSAAVVSSGEERISNLAAGSRGAASGISNLAAGSRGAASGISNLAAGSRGAASGLSSMRYALGPLANRSVRSKTSTKRKDRDEKVRKKRARGRTGRKYLWKRVLGRLRRK
jgi:RNA polymerase sigma-70 factor (ECF subfamily)